MAYVSLGSGFPYPYFSSLLPSTTTAGIFAFQSLVADAAGEMIAYIGHVYFAAGPGTSKTISSAGGKIQFRTGTVTWASAGTTVRVGIQDVNAASGPPAQPDENWTSEPYDDLVQGTDTVSSDTWTTATLSSGSRSITHGDLIAVVFDMTVRNGADSFTAAGLQCATIPHRPFVGHKTGGTWAASASVMLPNVILECDDGTLATIEHTLPASAVTTRAFNTGSTPDEYGNIINLTFDCKTNGLWASLAPGTGDTELNLYSSALGTPVEEQQYTVDTNQTYAVGGRSILVPIAEETLAAGSAYAVTVRPTTANNASAYEITVANAAHLAFWPGGTNVYKCTRSNDTGTFTTDTSSRMLMGFQVNQIDDGTGPGSTGGGSFTFLG